MIPAVNLLDVNLRQVQSVTQENVVRDVIL